jgi:hypothetical protein
MKGERLFNQLKQVFIGKKSENTKPTIPVHSVEELIALTELEVLRRGGGFMAIGNRQEDGTWKVEISSSKKK